MKKTILLSFILLSALPGFAQGSCATALPVTAGTSICGTITGDMPPQTCSGGTPATHAQWYVYIPLQNHNVTLTTDLPVNIGGDTDFGVFTGTCNNLTCFASDDDGGVLGNGYLSTATFSVLAGVTYYIAFDNKWSASGFTFQLIEAPYAPFAVTFTEIPLSGSNNVTGYGAVDLNGDYLDDIFSLSSASLQLFYQLPSGGFADSLIYMPPLQNPPAWSIAAGDLDRNGYNDLLLGGSGGASFLLANSTGTAYTEMPMTPYIFCQRTNFIDINNDGNLDAFVCHDVDTNVYFLNDGAGNMTYHYGGLGDHPEGGNYGSVWVDYDNDGDPDLFIAKCRGGASTAKISQLHRNDGNGLFTDVSQAAGMADSIQTWSSAWNDYDGDGFMDALIGANSSANGMHKLMHNNGDGTFTDVTAGSGWDQNTGLSREYLTYDFDNDGFADVLGGDHKIMRNNGDGTFSPLAVNFDPGPCGDLNHDGFIDVQNGNKLYISNGNDNHWITLTLKGIQSNVNGIGARVELYGLWGKQIRDVRSGEGFRYMHTLNVHFGTGAAATIDSIHVKWPSGIIDYIFDPAVDTILHIVEGEYPYPPTDTTSGIAGPGKDRPRIYPNPAHDRLYISHAGSLDIRSARIYTVDGKLLKIVLLDQAGSIPIGDLAAGSYVLRLETGKHTWYSHAFIKIDIR